MTALVVVAQDVEGVLHVEPHFWLLGDVRDRESEDHAPYVEWIERGYLAAIGEATDPKVVALKIAELNGQYRIQTLNWCRTGKAFAT